MAAISRTWWGQRFMEALKRLMESGRLQRGRSYRTPNRILKFDWNGHWVKAKVRGNVNHYYGIHKEPHYQVTIEMSTIAPEDWESLIQKLSNNAAWITQLLQGEIPDGIDQIFSQQGFPLLPEDRDDFRTSCTCPDYSNPCKHVAGVYFRVASMLDEDPFLLFELRGLSRKALMQELIKSPLGQALASQLSSDGEENLIFSEHCFAEPRLQPLQEPCSLREFWGKSSQFPADSYDGGTPGVSALLIKKQGDYPAFWDRDNSFIEAMEAIYLKIREKNRDSL
ncbi:MAG: SWIM zinc finger family protein [SAR324 cluster bacterium]|nr:SWIM zinc finger family protein [SAR324 cluster bacterium]